MNNDVIVITGGICFYNVVTYRDDVDVAEFRQVDYPLAADGIRSNRDRGVEFSVSKATIPYPGSLVGQVFLVCDIDCSVAAIRPSSVHATVVRAGQRYFAILARTQTNCSVDAVPLLLLALFHGI